MIKQLPFKTNSPSQESASKQQQQRFWFYPLVCQGSQNTASELICSESQSIFVFLSKSLWPVDESYFVCFILMNQTQGMGRLVFKQGLSIIQGGIFAFCVFFLVWYSRFKPIVPRSKSLYGKRRIWPQWWIKSLYPEHVELTCFVQRHVADMRNHSLIYVFSYFTQNRLKKPDLS